MQPVADPNIDSPHARPTSPLGHGKPLIHLPNPFAGFEPSKTLHTATATTGSSTSLSDGAGLRTRKSKPNRAAKDVERALPSSGSNTPTSPRHNLSMHSSSSQTDGVSLSDGPRVDVLAWMARATLDTIGEAGP